jgi:lysophospholipase L1-like esterase
LGEDGVFTGYRSHKLKFQNREKIVVAILAAIGLLFIVQPQPVFAGTNSQDSNNHQVDGGQILEEVPNSNFGRTEVNFSGLDTPISEIAPNSASALPDIRITPMGDSITKGFGTCADFPGPALDCIGFREDLWNAIVAGGYAADFIGSLGSDYQYKYAHDNDHEGHGGWSTTDIKNNIYGSGQNWLQNYPTDIILLHIGTNDFTNLPLVDPNIVVTRVEQILDKIDDYENDKGYGVLVILAKIIKRYDAPQPDRALAVENFNDALQIMANARISGGDYLTVVDMESALIPSDYLPDNLHPNSTGYSKMSAVWYPAIIDALNYPPTLTNPGAQSSIQGQTISLQMLATDPESDTLTYSAAGLPTGLTINPNSGEISRKVSISIPSGTNFPVTITADDKKGFPYTNPYNKDEVTFEDWWAGHSAFGDSELAHD